MEKRSLWESIRESLGFGRRETQRNRQARQQRRTFAIEPLEERALLSVCTWDGGGADNNWMTAANWSNDTAPVAGDSLVFSGTTRTATQNDYTAGMSFASIEFADDNFSLAGNAITLTSGITVDTGATGSTISLDTTLSGSNTFSVAASTSLTDSGVLSGSGSLAKTGNGTLVLTGANTYAGGTTLSAGTLSFVSGGLGTTGTITFDGGALQWAYGNTQDISSRFGAIGSGKTAILDTNGNYNVLLHSVISGEGGVEKRGSGYLSLCANNTYAGVTTIRGNGGSLDAIIVGEWGASAGSVGQGDVIFENNGGLIFFRGDTFVVNNLLTGPGFVYKNCWGTLVLNNGSNNYTHGTYIHGEGGTVSFVNGGLGSTGSIGLADSGVGGTLKWASGNTQDVSSRLIAITSGRELTLNTNGNNVQLASVISGSGSLIKAGSGTLTLSANNTYTGGTTISAGTLQVGAGGTSGSIAGNVIDNGIFVFNRSDNLTFSGVISGTGSLTKTGSGSLVLTGTNTYSGNTTVTAGALVAGDAAVAPYVLASGNASVDEGTSYTLNLSSTVTLASWSVNWQDGVTDSLAGSATSAAHTYADGTQTYSLVATATDSSSRTATVTFPVTVNNVAPDVTVDGEGLVGCWKLDESSGTTASDSSGNGFSGTLYNGAAWTSGGRFDGAVDLDGVNDYIQVSDNTTLKYMGGTDELTLSAWVYVDSTETTPGFIISKPWNGSGEYNYWLAIDSQRRVTFRLSTTTAAGLTTTNALSANGWHSVVATVDSSKVMTIYVDGAMAARGTHSLAAGIPVTGDSHTPLAIGTIYPYGPGWAGYPDHYSFDGKIDDVRIYDRAITAEEVAALMDGSLYEATEGSPYTLTLNPVVDPGDDEVTSYTVHWGDGQSNTYTAADVAAANRQVTHIYADDASSVTITLDVTDEDDTYTGVSSKTIAVKNVAPYLTIGGSGLVNEGLAYVLNLSASDPGDDTITSWTINWGDGNTQTVSGDPSSVAHVYADDGDYSITATATDEDGTYATGGTAGAFDVTFGSSGLVTTNLSDGNDTGQNVAIQSDGKIVMVGTVGGDICVIRYLADGTLDTTFGVGGIVTTDLGSAESAKAVAIQSDGKIVVGGSSNNDLCLVRYWPSGELDGNFGNMGHALTDLGGNDFIQAVAIQSDGRIVVAGTYNYNFLLARYNSDGTLDSSFDTDGKVVTDFGSSDFVRALAIQSDGKIVAAGYASNGTNYDFALARYNVNGSLDTDNFGTGGKAIVDFGNQDYACTVAIQSTGKIVVGGYKWSGSYITYNDFALARFTTAGDLDTSFGENGDGKVITNLGNDDYAYAIALQSDNKIILAGYSGGTNTNCALARYTAEGVLDTTFDGDGEKIFDISGHPDALYGLAIQSDGKILAAGYSNDGNDADFVLARLSGTNGALDATFGTNGVTTTNIAGGSDQALSVAIQSDGKLVVVGNAENGDFNIVRYNADGSLDATFDTDGIATTDFNNAEDHATSVTIQSNGKIVVAGYVYDGGDYDFALARYNTDGSLDTTFGTGGKVVTGLAGYDDFAYSMVILQNDAIVVAGNSYNSSGNSDFALARYDADGTHDEDDFGVGGFVLTDFGGYDDFAKAAAIQSDGKIVVAGGSSNGTHSEFVLARYNADGTPDDDFGVDGLATVLFAGSSNIAYAVAIQSDGKIVAAGSVYDGSDYDFALARCNANGTPDAGFSADGMTTADYAGGNDYANALSIQSDGKIVISGSASNGGNNDFALARYETNGDLDTVFGAAGLVTTDFHLGSDCAYGMAIQPDGKIVAVGQAYNGIQSNDFALARYLPGVVGTSVAVGYPTISEEATASATETNGSSVKLSVYGEDDCGESNLTYLWAVASKPAGAPDPVFSINGGDARNTLVAFGQAGDYEFTVTITDADGLSVTSDVVSVTVVQTLTSVVVTPETTTDLNAGDTQQFTAVARDQFGIDIPSQSFTWAANSKGTIESTSSTTALYTAPKDTSAIVEVVATVQGTSVSGSVAVSVVNERPTVAVDEDDVKIAAKFSFTQIDEDTYSNKEGTLTVLGDDDAGESHLKYHWTVALLSDDATLPEGWFSLSNSNDITNNDAKSTPITFRSAGLYRFTVTITDDEGLTPIGANEGSFDNIVYVQVAQTLTSIELTPAELTQALDAGDTQQFTAIAYDQFGDELIEQPTFDWTVTAEGSAAVGEIDDGFYTAPNITSSNTITVTSGDVSDEVDVVIINSAPTVATAASGSMDSDGLTAALSVWGDDDAGESNLVYSWTVISTPEGATTPTLSGATNGTNDASDVTATFTSLGSYTFRVTITDDGGLYTTSDMVTVTVDQVLTTITLSPLTPTVTIGSTQQFTATGYDQFVDVAHPLGHILTTPPDYTWSVISGSITDGGLYTPPNASMPERVTVECDGVSASTTILIVSALPTTTAQIGDTTIEAKWEQSLGSPNTGGTRDQHKDEATGNISFFVDNGNFRVVVNMTSYDNKPGYVTEPTNHFMPVTLTDSDTGTITPSSIVTSWTVGSTTYEATESNTYRRTIDYYDLGSGTWEYIEHWTSSYTITTTATTAGTTVAYATTTGLFNYTFTAGGNTTNSNYTCVVVGSAAATATGWSQTTSSSNTVANNSASGSGSRSGSGSTVWSYSSTSPYSSDPVEGSATNSGSGSLSYGYSLGYTQNSGSWSYSGSASNTKAATNHYSYSGSGVSTANSGSETVNESGGDHSSYLYTTYYTLPSNGAWQFTGGSGGSTGSDSSSYSYSGYGFYESSGDGEYIYGRYDENGLDTTSYDYSITATCSSTAWSESGSRYDAEGGNSHYEYSNASGVGGSGTYADASAEFNEDEGWESGGSLSESGRDDDSYHYDTYYTLDSDRTWQTAGGASDSSNIWHDTAGWSEGSGETHSAYAGFGLYWSSGSGQTMNGTFTESGSDNSTYSYRTDSTYSAARGWLGSSSDHRNEREWGASHYTYAGNGNYSDSGTGSNSGVWHSAGTLAESGSDHSDYDYTTNYALDEDGSWQAASGSGESHSSGESHWSYSGTSGSCTYSYAADGGTISGTFAESGSDNTAYNYSTSAACASGEWSESGSGWESEDGNSHYSYSGSCSTAAKLWGDYTWTAHGLLSESGHDDSSYNYITNYDLDESGAWQAGSGSGSSSGSGATHLGFESYSGTGSGNTYSTPSYYAGSLSGTLSHYQSDNTSYDYSTSATCTAGEWSESGSGSSTESGSAHYSFAGAGSYTRYPTTGTLTENGSATESYDYAKYYDLDADGNWLTSSGSGGSSGSGSTHSSYAGACSTWSSSFAYDSNSYSLSGTSDESGFDDTSYEFETSAVYSPEWGDWTETGTRTASGSGGASQSYTATDDYSYSTLTGAASASGSNATSYSFTKNAELDCAGQWQFASGSATASGSGESHRSRSASGSHDFDNPIDGGTATVPGTLDVSGSDHSSYDYTEHYELAPDDRWLAAGGTGATAGSGSTVWSYSSVSGSYTQGGNYETPVTLTLDGSDHATYTYSTAAACHNGLWTETGTASATDSGSTSYSYSGSGSYTHAIGGGTINGTVSQSGGGQSSYNYTKTSVLNPDNTWTIRTGVGSASGSASDHWSYSGSGEYSRSDSYGPYYFVEGTISESGSANQSTAYRTTSIIDESGYWLKWGRGSESDDSNSVYSYSGSGTCSSTSSSGSYNWSQSASFSEDGSGQYSTEHTEEWNLPSTWGWTRTRASDSASGSSESSFGYSYSGSGCVGMVDYHLIDETESASAHYAAATQYAKETTEWYDEGVWVKDGYELTTKTSSGDASHSRNFSPDNWYYHNTWYEDAFDCVATTTTTYVAGVSPTTTSTYANHIAGLCNSAFYVTHFGNNGEYDYGQLGTAYDKMLTTSGNGDGYSNVYCNHDSGIWNIPYSGSYQSVVFGSSPAAGFSSGVTHSGPLNVSSMSYDFVYSQPGGPSWDYTLTDSTLKSLKTQASWMTTVTPIYYNWSAAMPPALGVLTWGDAEVMGTANRNVNGAVVPWSAPSHYATARYFAIPLHEPDGSGTGVAQVAPQNLSLNAAAVDMVFAAEATESQSNGGAPPVPEIPTQGSLSAFGGRSLRTSAFKQMINDMEDVKEAANNHLEVSQAFAGGMVTGAKAVVNGTATAVYSVVTLGLTDEQIKLLEVTKQDRDNGYNTAVAIATASGQVFIAVGTGNISSVLATGGRVAKVASGGLAVFDAAGNAVGVVKGVCDMKQNGPNTENIARVAGGTLGLASNAKALQTLAKSAKEAAVAATLAKNIETLIEDTNKDFRLSKINAETILTKPTGATITKVAGKGGVGADVVFSGNNSAVVLQREAKCMTGGSSAFARELSEVADPRNGQLRNGGELWIQVKDSVTSETIEDWLSEFSKWREGNLTKYKDIELRIVHEDGAIVYSGSVK